MKKIIPIFTFSVFFFLSGCVTNIVQQKLDSAIIDSIHLLKSKEYNAFLKKYMEPTLREKLQKAMTLQNFSTQFGQKKGPELLNKLEVIKNKTPKFNDTGNIATIHYPPPEGNRHPDYHYISFVKINELWYLKGK